MENDLEHKISRLEAIETDVQRVLDFLGEQQRKKEEKPGNTTKTLPAGNRAETSDMACETLITSANFDFDIGRLKEDKLKVNNFFKTGKELIPNKRITDFSIELSISSPEKNKRPGWHQSAVSPDHLGQDTLGFSLPSPKQGEVESLSKRSSPRLDMLTDIEKAEDHARSERSNTKSKGKKSKKKVGLRLSLQVAPQDSERILEIPKPNKPRKLKPLALNDSWDDIKPIKASSYQVKRGLNLNANAETSENLGEGKLKKKSSQSSNKEVVTSSSSSASGRYF